MLSFQEVECYKKFLMWFSHINILLETTEWKDGEEFYSEETDEKLLQQGDKS